MKPKEFISGLRQEEIVAAIGAAEKGTSGEIRVFVSRHEPADAVAAAQTQFDHLGMRKTRERNGVLIYVAPKARKFAIIGDEAVHKKCGDAFWTRVADEMTGYFRKAEFTQGIVHGISMAGQLLAEHFPRRADDKNELSDQVEHD